MRGSWASASAGCACPRHSCPAWLSGATVLVTGGTGCIGSTLMAQVAARGPARLVSVSRGITEGWPQAGHCGVPAGRRPRPRRPGGADPRGAARCDLPRRRAARARAGPRSRCTARCPPTSWAPATCWRRPRRRACPRWCCASTGKALRPYSPDIYTASKRAAEWVASSVAGRGELLVSAGRFTHVLDNSVIYRRLLGWAEDGEMLSGCTAPPSRSTCSPRWSPRNCCCWRAWARSAASSGCTPSPTWAGRSACWTWPSGCSSAPAQRRRSTSAGTTPATRRSRSRACTTR